MNACLDVLWQIIINRLQLQVDRTKLKTIMDRSYIQTNPQLYQVLSFFLSVVNPKIFLDFLRTRYELWLVKERLFGELSLVLSICCFLNSHRKIFTGPKICLASALSFDARTFFYHPKMSSFISLNSVPVPAELLA